MRIDHTRLRLQVPVLAAMSAAIVSVLISFGGRTPLVIYNASGSAPLGFYYLENRFPGRGETAVVRPPPLIELMLVARGIMAPSVPLLKQIAAMGGDEVCRSKDPLHAITINGKVVAETFDNDRDGRPLPEWEGCLKLIEGEFFLLQPHPLSFDSRYFGPVLRCDIVGVARPLWTWNPPG
jgi:conjugative transfer signal peptidase TraF